MLLKEVEDTKKYVTKDGEERIKISSLSSGMTLSRPLKSFDGREILEAELRLDDDLIWRIWQLSSICPLNSPVIIKNNKKKKNILDLGKIKKKE